VSAGGAAERLRDAAFDLFAAQGFEATTVDDIAQRARVGRTTYFRHFRTKEDVVFPDHAALSAAVAARLEAADADEPPAVAVTEAALVVLHRYVGEGERSRARYRLVRSVEPLRARELASTQPYQRAFGRYLRRVLGGTDSGLYAEVLAAAVIAAHNNVLRRWLRRECDDPETELRAVVDELFRRWSAAAPTSGEEAAGSAVVVVRSSLPPQQAAALVERALGGR
jgi:AcrR family transcriptional regulator